MLPTLTPAPCLLIPADLLRGDLGNEAAIERDKVTGALTAEQMTEAKERIGSFTPKRLT